MRNNFLGSILAILFLVAVSGCSPTQQTIELHASDFAAIEEQKTIAEDSIRRLKDIWEDQTPRPTCYDETRLAYGEVRAAFNGWITGLKSSVSVGVSPNSTELKPQLESAIEKNEAFVVSAEACSVYVSSPKLDGLPSCGPNTSCFLSSGQVELATILIVGLTEAGIDIYREYKAAEQERQEAILNQLDELKWETFEDVS